MEKCKTEKVIIVNEFKEKDQQARKETYISKIAKTIVAKEKDLKIV